VEWNATTSEELPDEPVIRMFEAQVKRTPHAPALRCEGTSLSYRELNTRANHLAAHLRSLGVGPEVVVGICVERSWQLVAGILGILKAGGAYVPLDPAYPADRLGFILEDAQLPVVLTQRSLQSRFSHRPGEPPSHSTIGAPKIVCLDLNWDDFVRDGEKNTPPDVHAENLAYVIYTSGSTGKPKGVAVEHRSVTALVHWARAVFSDDELAGVLAASSICFDLSVFELFVPLSLGGRVILAENALQLPSLTAANEVTLLNTVPSAMKELLRVKGVPSSVRVINLAGEPLPTALVNRTYDETAVQRVYDLYGPTETTVYSTFTLRRPDEPATIGRPLWNESVYLLDAYRQPVPIGVVGEMYIGGAGLARGYFKRPELTEERFIHHSFFPEKPAERLFRTGDLARYRPDGNLEFLGRIDHQVKIRGFRIELGEIEAALRQHPGIRETIVMAREDQAGERRLVAYHVAKPGEVLTSEELRRFLQAKIAAYMVPSLFVPLDAVPLTPNGKVDRRALPAPDASATSREAGFVAPRNDLEFQLVGIWEEILQVRPIGVRHHFFELGGDSLLAARLVSRIASIISRDLRVGALFEAPTIEQLAQLLLDEQRENQSRRPASIVEIQPSGTKPPLFLVHGMGGGMFWGYANLSRHLGPDQPVYAFSSRGLDGREELATIEELAAHYAAELRTFQPQGPYYIGGYCFGGNVAYEMARLIEAQGGKVALLALFNCPARNSSYNRIRITPGFCLQFARNIHRRTSHVLGLERQRRRGFLRWKARVMAGKCRHLLERLRGVRRPFDAAEWEDLSRLPNERQQLWAAHIRAYLAHQPKRYAGHVTLFRTRDHEFLCSFDEAYGWRELASDVTVRFLPGAHESIFEETHVEAVATVVREHLAGVLGGPPTPSPSS
jgi:amino acid adenylation domain-containing protein